MVVVTLFRYKIKCKICTSLPSYKKTTLETFNDHHLFMLYLIQVEKMCKNIKLCAKCRETVFFIYVYLSKCVDNFSRLNRLNDPHLADEEAGSQLHIKSKYETNSQKADYFIKESDGASVI